MQNKIKIFIKGQIVIAEELGQWYDWQTREASPECRNKQMNKQMIGSRHAGNQNI